MPDKPPYIEDVITATEKALDDALWDGLDATYLTTYLASLRAAQSLGEKYEVEF
jgi:hypothetical protein